MITKRLFAVEALLFAGLAVVFFLPTIPKNSPAGISLKLPIWVDHWIGEDAAVTEKEIYLLAKDTQFARKMYTSPAGDKIFVSIVLSGDDMTNSIHRPERCLPAQGWTMRNSSARNIPLAASEWLPTTRLSNARIVETKGNRHLTIQNLTYYWFVGYEQITPSHLVRTLIDVHDRVFHGYNQRWAYVTVAATVTQGIARPERSEAETAAMIENFIAKLMPKLQQPNGHSVLALLKK